MFIDKHRHALAGFAKDLLHLIEEPALGIDGIAGGVFRIHAVLGNQQHAVHRQLARAQRERFLDGFVNGYLELLGPLAARVILGHLIGVQRNQLEIRQLALAIPRLLALVLALVIELAVLLAVIVAFAP